MKPLQVLFRTLLAPLVVASSVTLAHAAAPVANAGPDITIADSNGDASVIVTLNASASTDADDDIVSYAWTWPGGNASGRIAEAVFPVTNSPITITLTVTDATGGTAVDTLALAAFTKEAGLFTDFKKPTYSGTDFSDSPFGSRVVGSLRGNTLVIDPKGSGVPEIYQLNAGVWTPSPFNASVADIRAIDSNTLLSGNIASGNGFTAHRLVSGNWVATAQSVSATPPGRRIQDNSYEAQAVASSDSFDDTYFNNAGRAFVYDWTGNTWTHTELLPPEGLASSRRWGEGIDTDGTTTAVTDGSGSTAIPNLKIFKKAANWAHQISLAPPIEPGGFGQSYFSGIVAVGNGVVVAQRVFPYTLFVIEFNGSAWVQTPITIPTSVPFGGFSGLKMDDDGKSFVARDQTGHLFLYQRDALSPDWATATISVRQLPITGMFGGNQLLCTEFSGGKIVISDSVNGVVRVFDKNAPFDTINAEPVANAGADISTTSFDGQPVRLFLNGGLSSDASAGETLTAVWTWNGGSATGLQTFAMIPASVATITLTITDSKGAISRDTLATTIKRPAVIDPGDDVVAADSDGDGLIHLKVDPTVISQDYPIVSWNWRWPGGTFNGRSGIITLGPDADGKEVTLEAIDSNGLLSVTSFTFDLLNPNPIPDIIEPVDGVSLDRYGWAVGIKDGVALTGAPFKTANGTYLAENINDEWLQYSLASADRRGQAVLIDGDFAFVGAQFQGAGQQGAVVVYQQVAGAWVATQTLTPGDAEGAAFGNAIARSGNTLVIGAPQTGVFGASTGGIYLFELAAGSWSQVGKIVTPDPPQSLSAEFGAKVAISGNFLAVAQPGLGATSSVVHLESHPRVRGRRSAKHTGPGT
jgi:FG-GAP repeat/PKD domain